MTISAQLFKTHAVLWDCLIVITRMMAEAASVRFGPQLRFVFLLTFWSIVDQQIPLLLGGDTSMNYVVTWWFVLRWHKLRTESSRRSCRCCKHYWTMKDSILREIFCCRKQFFNWTQISIQRLSWRSSNMTAKPCNRKLSFSIHTWITSRKKVFDAVLGSVENDSGQLLPVDASGETGKTHTINLILACLASLQFS